MKILIAEDLAQAFVNGSVQLEKHEMVPWFLIEEDSVLIDGDNEVKIVGNIYTKKIMGNWYVKMDSTHRNEVVNNELSGGEPTMTAAMRIERQKLYAEQFPLVTVEQIMKLMRYDAMTPEEYRQEISDQLDEKKKPKYIEFKAPAKGNVIDFKVDLDDIFSSSAQFTQLKDGDIPYMLIHDKYHKVIPPRYTLEEATPIIGIMTYAKKKVMLPVDILLQRLWSLSDGFSKEDVDNAIQMPITEAEELEIQEELIIGATPELIALIESLGI